MTPNYNVTLSLGYTVMSSKIADSRLLQSDLEGTKQTIIFNADGTVQKVNHNNAVLGYLMREDIFTYETNMITELRTLISTGETLTFKHNLLTYETEVL